MMEIGKIDWLNLQIVPNYFEVKENGYFVCVKNVHGAMNIAGQYRVWGRLSVEKFIEVERRSWLPPFNKKSKKITEWKLEKILAPIDSEYAAIDEITKELEKENILVNRADLEGILKHVVNFYKHKAEHKDSGIYIQQ